MTTPLTGAGAVRDHGESTRSDAHTPVRAAATLIVLAYVALTLVFVAIGLVVVHVLAHGALGEWDVSVNRWFERHRSNGWNSVTSVFSQVANTPAVIAIAAVAVGVLALRRHWHDITLLVAALVLEVTVFVSTTFFVDRDRPPVAKLDDAPPTSSFPSGHVAAAVVLYTALAIIVTTRVRNRAAQVVAGALAVVMPVAVALSRLYRGMHHPTDVLAGVLLGLAALGVALVIATFVREPEGDR